MHTPKHIFIKLFGFLPLLLGSCEQDITGKVDLETTSKLVVMSFISPLDTVLEVHVRKSMPVVGTTNPETASRVTDATVELSDGTNRIRIPYDDQYKKYRVKPGGFAVVAGKTYHLSVSTPAGLAATGSCTIPSTEGIRITGVTTSEETSSNHTHNGAPAKITNMRFTWQDAPGQANYYRTYAFRTDVPPSGNNQYNRQPFNYSNMMQPYVSDQGKDGQELTSASAFAFDDWGPQGATYPRPYFLHTILTITDEAYYRYHRSMNQQIDAQGNPFAEPVILYNNLQGALGVFCGYNQVRTYKRVE